MSAITLLREAVNAFPQFDQADQPVNGAALVQWFAAWREQAKVETLQLVGKINETSGALECPHCGTEDTTNFRYVEDIGCARRIISAEDGQLNVDGYYETEGYDEGAENERIYCGACSNEFGIPPELEVDFS